MNNSWDPLAAAVENGHDKCVDLLVKAGADTKSSWDPLFAAVRNDYDKCLNILVEGGADVNIPYDEEGSLVMVAAKYGYAKCLDSCERRSRCE